MGADMLFASDVSRATTLSVSAYLRTSPCIPGQNHNDMGNDILLARVDLTPHLDAPVSHRVSYL